MKKRLLPLLISFSLFLIQNNSYATHLAGMELNYEYTGNNNDYLVTLKLTRSCETGSVGVMGHYDLLID